MSDLNPEEVLLKLQRITKKFGHQAGSFDSLLHKFGAINKTDYVYAVNDVDLQIKSKEVVGLVGESGCGKSTLGKIAIGLLNPDQGRLYWKGLDFLGMTKEEKKKLRLSIQTIFQDSQASLNPRLRAIDTITEAPIYHKLINKQFKKEFAFSLFEKVGLSPDLLDRYPHQLSGGQRSRLGIARALAVSPEFLVCDEAVASLDVSIQAQILNLFIKLREENNLTYLFISHDLGVVRHLTDRVVIMYLGKVVEEGKTMEIFSKPNHPYTVALLSEMPVIKTERKNFSPIKGEIPSPLDPPKGCHFHPRCPHAFKQCFHEPPKLNEISPGHLSACHLNDAL